MTNHLSKRIPEINLMSLFVREIEHFNLKDNQMGISLIIIHFIKFKIYLMIINYYPQTEKKYEK